MNKQQIINADCLEWMKTQPDNSIDCVVTDPPYGLSFMSKKWDYDLPSIEIWQELLRISKPGAMLLAFGGSRTYHRLTCSIEDAKWQIRDCLMWLTGQGFPKSCNFGKKLGDEWEGFGTALKPAHEPIIMSMKPLDGTYIKNAEKWGVAGLNIDASRIGEEERFNPPTKKGKTSSMGSFENCKGNGTNVKGRWPANLILDEESGKLLDEQSGILKASRFFYCAKASPSERNAGLEGMEKVKCWTGALRDNGIGKIAQNNHPTVKPIKLMEYLIKLVMPPSPDAVLLDPFAGSGTTILAAKNLGFNAIGIERAEGYCDIAEARLKIPKEETEK